MVHFKEECEKAPLVCGAFFFCYRPLVVPAVPLPPYCDEPVPLREVGPPAVPFGLPPLGSRPPLPMPVVPDMLWFPEPPVVLPFIEPPVVVPVAAGPPAAELPPAPADAPPLCASANVLDRASVEARTVECRNNQNNCYLFLHPAR